MKIIIGSIIQVWFWFMILLFIFSSRNFVQSAAWPVEVAVYGRTLWEKK